ncbi:MULTISPECIES: coenzyme-B sulfoethylthiotransferase subunit alpha [Methanobacterium]|jgi:methyl-coenzyme M reductase alpha subunit|uniref:Methyl-coenzyme M reductase subunit alpha n=9 Tax=Methanobacteriota TaxID=28890 RepID=A0A090I2G6_METFO|nr:MULTISPECIES: coenzyme-B sulfoethylthiotransferase subunit alpha [Methanobacterium]AIS31752.1 methyl-coenzyme M reductase alpha subunit McrA [Methanobacterium formicicum]AXV40525.1 MAG: coenzyme-B sulfoethylthiotransferase subunit alpha [Methanobacterium sp. BAmetb5]KUK74998.1 MAG: Methyl coenzyme M reductase I subunit alpha [Methanobacterium sp. 42_16]MDG3548200.1 coenzyme-B sulfoethylthiotransferase subunit alpha [Methanobacterium formicicum]MDH2659864.1 coenzyme-B sulfoethylthiotransfera
MAEKMFINALKKAFEEDPSDKTTTFYKFGGWRQSERKREFVEAGKEVAAKRGIPQYDPDVGTPLGQRVLMPYQVSTTDTFVEGDDLHFVNNAAMQQFWDDIRRTVIVGLNTAHSVIEKRLGKEVTPETITHYLETVNHAMPGAAVVQEHMVETHPLLTADSYVKVFTGNDEIADEIDQRYVLNINEEFPEHQADVLKAEVGDGMWTIVRIPTIVSRTCDGGTTSRWSAMQVGMSMISAYKQAAGEAATGDFAYAAKHAEVIHMGTYLPVRRARGENEPGGIAFGYLADICQSSRVNWEDPVRVTLDVVASGAMLYDQIWLGSYMSGGVGFTQYATAAYTDNILDDFTYFGKEYVEDKYGITEAPNNMDTVLDVASEVTFYALEQFEDYPALLETIFGGSQRASIVAAAAGCSTAFATGNAQTGLSGWYLSMYLHKEQHSRLGFYGYDLQDQCGASNVFSIRGDEGLPTELRGANYPNYAMNVGHQGEYAGIAQAAHAARGDAFVLNPLVKIAFADPNLTFDFTQVRAEFAKGALREFEPAGERALISPAK